MCVLLLDCSIESYLCSGISNYLIKVEYAQALAKIAFPNFTCQIRIQLHHVNILKID